MNRLTLESAINFVGENGVKVTPETGAAMLKARATHPLLKSHPALPDDTRLWAALQQLGGGTWGGCVYDVDAVIEALRCGGAR